MAFVAKSSKAYQVFRGALNKLGLWAQHLGSGCCGPEVAVDIDRLAHRTTNPENALIHISPSGGRDHWKFSDHADSDRQRINNWINTQGVGAQLEIMVLPTHSFLTYVTAVVLAEESGLVFELKTRNGTPLPEDQLIKVDEVDSGDGCTTVARTEGAGDFAALGPLNGSSRVYHYGAAANGGHFVMDNDALILEVVSLPAGGVKGFWDILIHGVTVWPGRSEATF